MGGMQAILQAAIRAVYPPACLACEAAVASDFGLCGTCWRDTPFVAGLVCDLCGTPLPGDDPGHPVHCDDCLQTPRPWDRGRAALLYQGRARDLVLALKHADRLDLVGPAAGWMRRAGAAVLRPDQLVVPVPLHRGRLFRRRYNQSALLSAALARTGGLDHCPDALIRRRATPSQDHRSRDARFANLDGAPID
ncbi:MAG: ComF family protein, partial [Rhodobacterales bacterium]|nr:ComF family protein [Rhodobacterales bacterium]